MCGEMAGDINSVPLLLGLGLHEFSMSATSIPKARMIVNNLAYSECQKLAEKALTLETVEQVNNLVSNFLKQKQLI
jgi:phosphotransferase system enzyme I (PtsI)